jgi:hypothetical protein
MVMIPRASYVGGPSGTEYNPPPRKPAQVPAQNKPGATYPPGTLTPATDPFGLPPEGRDLPFTNESGYLPNLPYAPKAQPVLGGGKPAYYLDPSQLYPLVRNPGTTPRQLRESEVQAGQELIPTSVNVRNLALQRLLQQYQLPMEQIYTGQLAGAVSRQRAGQLDQLRTMMTRRGLFNSGAADEANLGVEMGYLQGMGQAGLGGQQQDEARRRVLMSQIMAMPENDIRFYQAIRTGTIPAGVVQDQHAQDWQQAMHGVGTAVRSLATMAAGGVAGGTFNAAGGQGTFGSDVGAANMGDMGLSGASPYTSGGYPMVQNVYGQTFSGGNLGGGPQWMQYLNSGGYY